MENKLNFTDKDKEKVIEYLNFVATNAKFELNTKNIIVYFNLLSYMQKDLIPKIDSNIFEVKRVIESKESKEE